MSILNAPVAASHVKLLSHFIIQNHSESFGIIRNHSESLIFRIKLSKRRNNDGNPNL